MALSLSYWKPCSVNIIVINSVFWTHVSVSCSCLTVMNLLFSPSSCERMANWIERPGVGQLNPGSILVIGSHWLTWERLPVNEGSPSHYYLVQVKRELRPQIGDSTNWRQKYQQCSVDTFSLVAGEGAFCYGTGGVPLIHILLTVESFVFADIFITFLFNCFFS